MAAGRALAPAGGPLHLGAQPVQGQAEGGQGPGGDAFGLGQEAEQQVLDADRGVAEAPRLVLGGPDHVPCPVGEPFEHLHPPSGCRPFQPGRQLVGADPAVGDAGEQLAHLRGRAEVDGLPSLQGQQLQRGQHPHLAAARPEHPAAHQAVDQRGRLSLGPTGGLPDLGQDLRGRVQVGQRQHRLLLQAEGAAGHQDQAGQVQGGHEPPSS